MIKVLIADDQALIRESLQIPVRTPRTAGDRDGG